MNLAAAFQWLQALKEEGAVLDYALTQATLEQIFVQFAGQEAVQGEEQEDGNSLEGNAGTDYPHTSQFSGQMEGRSEGQGHTTLTPSVEANSEIAV